MVCNKLVTEIKTILYNLCVRGGEISRKTVIPIGNGVLGSRCPEISTKNVESVTIITKWARGILKSLDLVERCSATTKRGRNPEWYEELTFIWKTKIVNAILEHSIYHEMILNLIKRYFVLPCPTKQPSLKKMLNQRRVSMLMISAK